MTVQLIRLCQTRFTTGFDDRRAVAKFFAVQSSVHISRGKNPSVAMRIFFCVYFLFFLLLVCVHVFFYLNGE